MKSKTKFCIGLLVAVIYAMGFLLYDPGPIFLLILIGGCWLAYKNRPSKWGI